jgi:iron complex outermembrane receptor protein
MTLVPDKLFVRVAGVGRTSDGYVTRLDYACANNLPDPGQPGGLPTYAPSFGCELGKEGGQSYTAGRMNLRWVAGEEGNVELNLAASFVNDDSQSQPGVLVAAKDHSGSNFPWLSPNGPSFNPADPFTCIGIEPWANCAPNNPSFFVNPASGGTVPSFYDNNNNGTYEAGTDVSYDSRFVTGGTYTNYATYINDGASTPSPLFQGGVPGQNMDIYKPYVIEPINHLNSSDVSLNLNWQIGDNTSLLWVYALREYKNEFAEDTDGSPIAVQQLLQVMDHEQWTQELRLNTSFGDGFADFTIGAFYLDQDTAEDARVDLPYVGFDFIHGPDLVPATNQAIYTHLAFHLGDRMDLSLGVRYSEDEKSYTFRRRNPDLTPVQPCTTFWFWESPNPANCGVYGDPGRTLDGLSVAYSSDNTDYRVALSYDVGDATMVYGQFSTGYKAGGNNARPFFPSQLNAFKPETLDSIELGMKSTLGGNSRLNMAVFSNQYADIQLPTNVCTWAPPGQQTPCASQNNVGDADVWGFEVEAEWHPGDRATIDASYSMLDFEYTRIDPGATSVTLDMITPYTPENKLSLGAQYEFEVGNGTLTPRIDVSFQDDIFANATNAPTNFIESYTLVNARLTWRSVNEDWRIALEATNLTDEYYYVTLFDLWGPVGYVHGQPGRPAEYALSINRSF